MLDLAGQRAREALALSSKRSGWERAP
jgi:hypothetical protein